ncbi:hypothetical protein K435DRAFT_319201 [Dendrothele bispora CBS 962.96]|uniref:Uncharacterized protein n=1 Tax=Dendrothele bispora (strain CBS 962.96) TaxID=1314807 RepID=A0A4S8LGD1_DENBC|nr:hypothetical protein K435DRAFT_319201 [Dendrothele bispora CBS 962.96]
MDGRCVSYTLTRAGRKVRIGLHPFPGPERHSSISSKEFDGGRRTRIKSVHPVDWVLNVSSRDPITVLIFQNGEESDACRLLLKIHIVHCTNGKNRLSLYETNQSRVVERCHNSHLFQDKPLTAFYVAPVISFSGYHDYHRLQLGCPCDEHVDQQSSRRLYFTATGKRYQSKGLTLFDSCLKV